MTKLKSIPIKIIPAEDNSFPDISGYRLISVMDSKIGEK